MLTIITHVNPNRTIDNKRCFESVRNGLANTARHVVLECDAKDYRDFLIARYQSLKFGEWVAFVDDDDYINPLAIQLFEYCINLYPHSGIIYTNEIIEDDHGRTIRHAGETYESLFESASSIHHMCAIRTNAVSSQSLNLALHAGCGIEWAMKAEASLKYGAIHIPEPLYTTVRRHNERNVCNHGYKYHDNHHLFINKFKEWQHFTGTIPKMV